MVHIRQTDRTFAEHRPCPRGRGCHPRLGTGAADAQASHPSLSLFLQERRLRPPGRSPGSSRWAWRGRAPGTSTRWPACSPTPCTAWGWPGSGASPGEEPEGGPGSRRAAPKTACEVSRAPAGDRDGRGGGPGLPAGARPLCRDVGFAPATSPVNSLNRLRPPEPSRRWAHRPLWRSGLLRRGSESGERAGRERGPLSCARGYGQIADERRERGSRACLPEAHTHL